MHVNLYFEQLTHNDILFQFLLFRLLQRLLNFDHGITEHLILNQQLDNRDELLQEFLLDKPILLAEIYQFLGLIVIVHHVTIFQFDLINGALNFLERGQSLLFALSQWFKTTI